MKEIDRQSTNILYRNRNKPNQYAVATECDGLYIFWADNDTDAIDTFRRGDYK